jgi:dihydroorotate dehydrogenase
MLYPLLRSVFFSLDPETAHGLGMTGVDFLTAPGIACLLAKRRAAGSGTR